MAPITQTRQASSVGLVAPEPTLNGLWGRIRGRELGCSIERKIAKVTLLGKTGIGTASLSSAIRGNLQTSLREAENEDVLSYRAMLGEFEGAAKTANNCSHCNGKCQQRLPRFQANSIQLSNIK